MASGTVIAGAAALRVNGVIYNCEVVAGSLGGYQYTKVVGMRGSGGDKAEWIAPKLTATIILDNATSMATIKAWKGVTAELQILSGRSFVYEGASIANDPEYDAAEGKCSVELQADTATETGL